MSINFVPKNFEISLSFKLSFNKKTDVQNHEALKQCKMQKLK